MALDQASVGLSNDWIDADRDRAVGRPDKPVARGDIPASLARNVAIGTAIASVLVSIPLGWAAVLAHLVFLLGAWSYNAGLKGTPISVLPYLVSFGILPTVVTLSAAQPDGRAVVGDGRRCPARRRRTLRQRAPRSRRRCAHGDPRVSRIASVGCRPSSSPGPRCWPPLHPSRSASASTPRSAIVGLGAAALIAIAGLALGMRRAPTRVLFRLVILAALVDVAMLVVAGAMT